MAMEVSCLTGVDEDEKDAESEIHSFMLLQPVKMAQESCTDSFDVLSSPDMLSPIGLANGPSLHQATQAHEPNCITSEKEEEKSITQLKTVQEIDSPGIWGFDTESTENSLDNFNSAGDLNWDPHKEFMQFLLENHNESPTEEPKEDTCSANSQRRRKRKMDMVVMVDPSEDLYPDLSPKSSDKSSDAEGLVDSSPVREVSKPQKLSKPQSSATEVVPKYPNGTVKAIKEVLYETPARSSCEINVNDKLPTLQRRLKIISHSQRRPSSYSCPKCKLVFKKEHRLLRHMKSHKDPPKVSTEPFICRECGKSFKQSNALINHMSTHREKTTVADEVKDRTEKKKKEDKNADKKFFCPQCPFGTSCPNSFVAHAKTHEKDKRKYRCDKCSYRTVNDQDLRRHNVMHHTVIRVRKRMQKDDNEVFPCNICSYKAFGKYVFEKHLLIRHDMSFEEYTAAHKDEITAQKSKERKSPVRKTQFEEFRSKMSVQNQISKKVDLTEDSGGISDLLQNSKFKRDPKSQLMESKLDKSINVLLSRQNHRKKGGEHKEESNNMSTNDHDSKKEKDGCDESQESSAQAEDSSGTSNGPKLRLDHPSVKKSQSKRKMSTPYRNTSDQDSCFILPKPLPSPKKVNSEDVSDRDENDIFPVKDSEANGNHFNDLMTKEKKHIIYTYSRRMSMRGALQASKKLFEKIKTEEEQSEVEIKEECIETEVYQETFESHQIPLGESPTDDLSELEMDSKKCPYCPAIFESGVGLSNHVRGHLHRVRLSYDSQNAVPSQEGAYRDQRPRMRRKNAALRRLKKALQEDSDSETVRTVHSCPLCGDSFDNRTGQSNHIRGHLKKLGRNFSTKTKSPIILLRELMRDKKECQRALQILGKRRNNFRYGALPKFPVISRFTSSQMGFPKSQSVSNLCTDAKPLISSFSLEESKSENGQPEKLEVKNSVSGTTALIGILKKRKCQEDAKQKGSSQVSRNGLPVSSNTEEGSGSKDESSLPNPLPGEKGEFNRKVCIHCNATFHSGVSLSNHLRAFAKRQQIALLEGTTIQCKAVRTRSRPGLKKKTLPLAQSPEEMYRLTCRFCDLVFQGPLSVQEDWIKHLQRHIMNTGVPNSGLGMAEVTSLSENAPILKTDQDSSLSTAHAAS
ncbi:zinc finger protein 644a [Cyprinodon tularosa]|uniref:zinc finger protein 644a n=1 Tax=Cyprinodon tularosa TaxID=77115 RepID=UPI0018E1E279|nr:zinc finger protein 644a [Cyprinodon tularosa]